MTEKKPDMNAEIERVRAEVASAPTEAEREAALRRGSDLVRQWIVGEGLPDALRQAMRGSGPRDEG
ncbi:hypothetical protein [Sphingomonas oryzagri]